MLFLVGSVVYFVYEGELATPNWVLLATAVLLLWFSFAMPTYCDFSTVRGTPCRNRVNGKLRGCHQHGRDKRDAVWRALFRVRNPGEFFRVRWHSSAVAAPQSVAGAARAVTRSTTQGTRDATIFVCTILSTVAGVVGTVASVLGLWK
ncbi:hypothetical protein BLA60_16990 [Actinophytocola xinjiangensis]|uniref:Uncharacterized protein n=1 Tax=Actinophytocola xinjiangensis TaxID=485602 RepID=A0A7Z0WPV7_9PSEU|nr:hypothetical protein [Actinophytocola xinjiangensis]OLF10143.1 hypothetical protein BLA60_16990 [Actinophytocola xinjiangensis]